MLPHADRALVIELGVSSLELSFQADGGDISAVGKSLYCSSAGPLPSWTTCHCDSPLHLCPGAEATRASALLAHMREKSDGARVG